MIRRIQSHNTINGIAFAICEFALIAIVVAPFGIAWALRGKPLYGLAVAGIIANCLCVIALGVQAWRAGQGGSQLRLLFSSANRARLSKEHPRMSEDTLVMTLTTLIPFGLAVLTLLDYSRSRA